MATPEQIMDVREKTNEGTNATWSDEDISALVDGLGGVNQATANIWRKKAARYADQTDVSEAGASRSLNQLYAKAKAEAAHYEEVVEEETGTSSVPAAKVHIIRRTN